MKKAPNNPFDRLYKACGYSLVGLRAAYRNEQAFRQEVWLGLILVPLAFYLTASPIERSLLIGAWLLVMITELLNSAIEAVVDRFGDEWHELAGRAKDIASAAVFLSLVLALLVWFLIVLTPI
ncbi:diacylglycerol kinase [Sulfuriflexus mobilis]|uniref:diacylglycerol kinase n=1 Tax=Sulfuriflexus mobilis TaxID=1811807 RepID=UPI000F82A00B|nr:diacylglycerol kinase [Sulfuriflexus mobilis]